MRITVPLLLVLLLTAPAHMAQTPVDPSVTVTIDVVDNGASIDAPAVYTVTVENTSPATTTGQDPPMDVSLTVSGTPEGWTAALDQASFQLIAGESASATLTVAVTGSAVEESATITVDATIRNGAFPPLELTATGSDSVDVARDDSGTRQAQEALGDYLWIIVVAGVAIYVVSTALLIMLFRKREAKDGGKQKVATAQKKP